MEEQRMLRRSIIFLVALIMVLAITSAVLAQEGAQVDRAGNRCEVRLLAIVGRNIVDGGGNTPIVTILVHAVQFRRDARADPPVSCSDPFGESIEAASDPMRPDVIL
jgi:hypothetical protein